MRTLLSSISFRELSAFAVLTFLLALGTLLAWSELRYEQPEIRLVPTSVPVPGLSKDGSSDDNRPYVNLNTASVEELMLLPGIGPRRAEAIIADRQQRGPFPAVDSLVRVRGIGPKTVERLRPWASVSRERAQ